jgi:Uma2 family endonuclease
MSTTHLYTVADLLAIEDADRYELIKGELFEVSPASFDSSVIAMRIATAVSNVVDQHDLGYLTGADGGFLP